jgi:hypothetical protein
LFSGSRIVFSAAACRICIFIRFGIWAPGSLAVCVIAERLTYWCDFASDPIVDEDLWIQSQLVVRGDILKNRVFLSPSSFLPQIEFENPNDEG